MQSATSCLTTAPAVPPFVHFTGRRSGASRVSETLCEQLLSMHPCPIDRPCQRRRANGRPGITRLVDLWRWVLPEEELLGEVLETPGGSESGRRIGFVCGFCHGAVSSSYMISGGCARG